MILATTIRTPGERIDYSYNITDDTHLLWFAAFGRSVFGSAGRIISALADYREYREVRELIAWLAR